jgi:hypothetical protein
MWQSRIAEKWIKGQSMYIAAQVIDLAAQGLKLLSF